MEGGQEGVVAFEGCGENGVGEVVPLGERHRFLGDAVVGGLEVADAGAGLVDADAEAQGGEFGEAGVVAALDALGGGEDAEDAAFGGGCFGGAAGEAGGGPPGLQGAGQQQGEDAHEGLSRWSATAWPTWEMREVRLVASLPIPVSFSVFGPTRRTQVRVDSSSP
ncbi:hypothetical protein EES46_19905 [Streptomyces sp. ADI98-10]|nr:hypothetical protein EES46_19905 [Streptomyces sp. ADI98-10]